MTIIIIRVRMKIITWLARRYEAGVRRSAWRRLGTLGVCPIWCWRGTSGWSLRFISSLVKGLLGPVARRWLATVGRSPVLRRRAGGPRILGWFRWIIRGWREWITIIWGRSRLGCPFLPSFRLNQRSTRRGAVQSHDRGWRWSCLTCWTTCGRRGCRGWGCRRGWKLWSCPKWGWGSSLDTSCLGCSWYLAWRCEKFQGTPRPPRWCQFLFSSWSCRRRIAWCLYRSGCAPSRIPILLLCAKGVGCRVRWSCRVCSRCRSPISSPSVL